MKLSVIFMVLSATVFSDCVAQKKSTKPIETIQAFVDDFRNGRSNEDIFAEYLASRGLVTDDVVRAWVKVYSEAIRTAVESTKPKDVRIYKYTDRPEKVRRLQPIEEFGSAPEMVPLEFTIDTVKENDKPVNVDNLYVLKLMKDETYYILFNNDSDCKMITFFSIQWGHRIAMMEL